VFDLLVLWAWEYDADFIDLLDKACAAQGVRACMCGPNDMPHVARRLDAGEIQARCCIDRVWDWGGEFELHMDAVRRHVPLMLNDYDKVRRIWNKVTMHMELIAHGLHAPYLMLVPSIEENPHPPALDLAPLGRRFSIKGVHSGGSGVLKPAMSWSDVLEQRREWPTDQTIVQAWVEPKMLGSRRAWFRVFYACGTTYVCWADDKTHVQEAVTPEEERRFQLGLLRGMAQQIAGLCSLNLFSTEIALADNNIWHVCDYVNEPCDYRLKSSVVNGVPDAVVAGVADRIASWVKRNKK
jgi:hypothetical protein